MGCEIYINSGKGYSLRNIDLGTFFNKKSQEFVSESFHHHFEIKKSGTIRNGEKT